MVSLETLAEQFDELGFDPPPTILEKCFDLCIKYNITNPTEFVEQWMAFSVSHLNGAEPTLENLDDLELKELSKQQKTIKFSTPSSHQLNIQNSPKPTTNNLLPNFAIGSSSADLAGGGGNDDIMDSYMTPGTPKTSNKAQSKILTDIQSSPLTSKGDNLSGKDSGLVVCTFGNAALVKRTNWSVYNKQEIIVNQIPFTNETNKNTSLDTAKYMHDRLQDTTEIFANQLSDIGEKIYKKLKLVELQSKENVNKNSNEPELEIVETKELNRANQNIIRCAGRIYSESNAKLDHKTAMMLGIDDNFPRKVSFNFSNINKIGLFPGQVVIVEGFNPRGDVFFPAKIYTERELQFCDKAQLTEKLTKPINMIVATGPFTHKNNLKYEPLNKLLNYCKQNKPNVLIMLGPFLDDEHSLIIDGVLTETYDLFFEQLVLMVMNSVDAETHVIMVASSLDAHSSMVYPTPSNKINRQITNLTLVSDPSVIELNGLRIGLTSTDIIQHLNETEFAVYAGEKIKRIINYMFHHESFYPLYPPSLKCCVDHNLSSKFATSLDIVPNILIVPSDLRYFVRDINGCLVLNSGRLVNDQSDGTFARLVFNPSENYNEHLSNYVTCQIVNI